MSEVNKLDGKASINHHKGKFTFFYERSIKLNWTGTSGVQYKGRVEILNLSDENSVDEMEISVSFARNEPDTNLVALKNQQHPQNRVHMGYDTANNHGESVDPAGQPELKTEAKSEAKLRQGQICPFKNPDQSSTELFCLFFFKLPKSLFRPIPMLL